MASIGVVNADSPNKQEPSESTNRPKEIYFGVFFDGTDNNMIQKDTARRFREKNSKKGDDWETEVITINDETFKNGANQLHVQGKDYSNVAILHSIYRAMSEDLLKTKRQTKDVTIYNIYIEGPGRDTDQNSRLKGLGFGTGKYGVCSMVSKAVNIIRQRINAIPQHELPNTDIHFDVFGFSRGATGARLFSYLALRKNGQKLGCESELKEYSAKKYFDDGDFLHFLDTLNLKTVTVDFLGIFDTVSSIGGVTVDSYINNTTDYGLYSPVMDKVLHTFHLCAMDEFREHFALTDIGNAVDKNSNAEIFIPGCHADVGGGYLTGSDEFELSSTLNPTLCFPSDKIENKPLNTLPLCKESLEKMGWITAADSVDETLEKRYVIVEVKRNITFGYSNIPLAMMRKRSVQKNVRQTFANIPPGYQINENLFGTWSKTMMELAKDAKGRSFYYPGGSYTSPSYAKLRKYLHFSASDTIKKTFSGGLPTYNPATMLYCRFLYKGNINDSTRLYMYQYYL